MKYIFVTGGVISSLGKGLTAASSGLLLESMGLKVVLQKFDPYLNIDAGTMNPYQHGEVYILEDGTEADLDLGHYERFTNSPLSSLNNLTSGQIYQSILSNERAGKYLGQTVQVIPHVTDMIKERISLLGEKYSADVVITEIGGTVGDIEGLPFLEAIRQFCYEIGDSNALIMHVTWVPHIHFLGEVKTKPTQQSVSKLREIGISPSVLMCRCSVPLSAEIKKKISMFCNIPVDCVIEEQDVSHSIYQIPLMLHREKLDKIIVEKLSLKRKEPNLRNWKSFVDSIKVSSECPKLKVAIAGKYSVQNDSYYSLEDALLHAKITIGVDIKIINLDIEVLNDKEKLVGKLKKMDAVIIPGGFGSRGISEKLLVANFLRKNNIPFLGICLGMQVACIEFAMNELKLERANSTEFDKHSPNPVILLQEDQKHVTDKGSTMRLGAYDAKLVKGTKVHDLYNKNDTISERHRHRYEFNIKYKEIFEKNGLIVSASSTDGKIAEVIEHRDHPFFIACQFHPEFKSKPNNAHPLFCGLLKSAMELKKI